MDLQLRDRVVLVVGGTGLIGSAVVARVRAEGATVVVASRRGSDGIAMDAGSDGIATDRGSDGGATDAGSNGVVMDARNDASVSLAVSDIVERYGRLDAVVVTAAPSAATLDQSRNSDPAQVAEAFDAKALVFLRVANAVIPVMRAAGYGRIVGISGQNAFVTGNITGSIRNAALIIAAKNLADELAGTGVTVVTVSPGVVSVTPSETVDPGKPGQSSPIQIADLVAFLASPIAAVSGESIAVGHRVRGAVSF
jgi:NAD(P)-dependent dehydrogenase (short-subunit alcohol dehydrogenase family)